MKTALFIAGFIVALILGMWLLYHLVVHVWFPVRDSGSVLSIPALRDLRGPVEVEAYERLATSNLNDEYRRFHEELDQRIEKMQRNAKRHRQIVEDIANERANGNGSSDRDRQDPERKDEVQDRRPMVLRGAGT